MLREAFVMIVHSNPSFSLEGFGARTNEKRATEAWRGAKKS